LRLLDASVAGSQQSANQARLQGYLDALADAGIERDNDLIVATYLQPDSGVQPTENLLALSEPPTAIFAFHDLVAVDVIKVLQQQHIRVPEDISVVGFDGLRAGFMTMPQITTVAQPLQLIGQRVIEIVNRQIENPDTDVIQEVVPVELVLRGSSAHSKEQAPQIDDL